MMDILIRSPGKEVIVETMDPYMETKEIEASNKSK